MQYYFDKTFIKLNFDQYNDKRQAIKILLPVIVKLGSKIEQDYWLKQLSQIINITEAILQEALEELRKKLKNSTLINVDNQLADNNQLIKQNREEMLSELLLALIIKQPMQIEYVANRVGPDEIVGEINQLIYRSLIIYYNEIIKTLTDQQDVFSREINCQDFGDWLNKQQEPTNQQQLVVYLNKLDRLAILADKDFYNYSLEQAKAEIINIINVLKKNYLSNRLKNITKLISQIEKVNTINNNKEEELKSLLEEFQTLAEEIKEIN